VAVGIGMSIAMACDMMVVGEGARFAQVFQRVGEELGRDENRDEGRQEEEPDHVAKPVLLARPDG